MTATARRRSPPPRGLRVSPKLKTTKRPTAKAAAPTTIDEYLARLPADQGWLLTKMRRTIRAAAPGAAESISYGVPTFKLDGTPVIYFAAAKAHCALYAIDPGTPELKGFETSKGTVRFTPEKPVPAGVVTKLVKARVARIEGGRSSR